MSRRLPDPNDPCPVPRFDVTYVKPTLTRPNIVVGVGSVVGSDVEPYTIVAGNPAKPVRKRFDDELIALLEAFKWWDRSIEEIQSLIPLLSSGDLESVRKRLK
jgi:hypothetical protein